MKINFYFLLILVFIMACSSDDEQRSEHVVLSFDFSPGAQGWTGDFADYPAGEEEFYALEFGHSLLPDPLDNSEGALKLSGNNHSDDLFMFVKRPVQDLIPGREYFLSFQVEIASNVAEDQMGIGGSPGESVYIKAGGSTQEPQKQQDEMGWYRLNIDKGNQAGGGEDMMVIGDFTNGTAENIYSLKRVSTPVPLRVTASSEGRIWLLFGTDSGFEGETTIYINWIKVELHTTE